MSIALQILIWAWASLSGWYFWLRWILDFDPFERFIERLTALEHEPGHRTRAVMGSTGGIFALIWPVVVHISVLISVWGWAGLRYLVCEIAVFAILILWHWTRGRRKRIAKLIGAKAKAARDRLVASMPTAHPKGAPA